MDLKKDFEEIKQSIDNENVNNNQAEQQAILGGVTYAILRRCGVFG